MNLSLSPSSVGTLPEETGENKSGAPENWPKYELTARACQDKHFFLNDQKQSSAQFDRRPEYLNRPMPCCTKLTNNASQARCYSESALVSRTYLRKRHCREPISRDSSELSKR